MNSLLEAQNANSYKPASSKCTYDKILNPSSICSPLQWKIHTLHFIFHNTNKTHNTTLNYKANKTEAAFLGIYTLRISRTAKTKSPFSHKATLCRSNCSHTATGHINNTTAVQHNKQFHSSWYCLQDDISVTGSRFILLSKVT